MNIHATLSSLLLALLTALNPHAVAAACVEDSAEVVVRVYRFSEGPPAYAFHGDQQRECSNPYL